jgi:hypothetical protein
MTFSETIQNFPFNFLVELGGSWMENSLGNSLGMAIRGEILQFFHRRSEIRGISGPLGFGIPREKIIVGRPSGLKEDSRPVLKKEI